MCKVRLPRIFLSYLGTRWEQGDLCLWREPQSMAITLIS